VSGAQGESRLIAVDLPVFLPLGAVQPRETKQILTLARMRMLLSFHFQI
jgi:hypothetical protein